MEEQTKRSCLPRSPKCLKGGSNMRKVIGLVFIMFVLLIGCAPKIDFADGDPFVKLELYSASAGTYVDHFPKIITVSNDGSVHVFTKEIVRRNGKIEMEVGDDAPTIKKEISAKEVKEIKQVIEENRFFSIPEDVTDSSVMDGDGSRITVYEKGKQREVGGENSSHKRYNAIEEIIFNQVKDEYGDWKKETEDYLFELNE